MISLKKFSNGLVEFDQKVLLNDISSIAFTHCDELQLVRLFFRPELVIYRQVYEEGGGHWLV